MNYYGIIVAGGSGTRFGTTQPKQFQLLDGLPMLMHPIRSFSDAIAGIQLIVVLPDDYLNLWQKLCADYRFHIPHTVTSGGPERYHSVKRGLSLVQKDGLVAVHDGARPLVSPGLITVAFNTARIRNAVVPAITPSDSVRQVAGAMNKPLNRETLRLIQTPQVFDVSLLKKAYQQNYHPSYTDDATVIESIGVPVALIQGDPQNIKITGPLDLLFAEAMLKTLSNHDSTI